MKRCSFREWIPILPWPVWPLAWQCALGQNTVVGSMTILLAMRGNIATRSMSGPPFALQLHRTTVWCGATGLFACRYNTLSVQQSSGGGRCAVRCRHGQKGGGRHGVLFQRDDRCGHVSLHDTKPLGQRRQGTSGGIAESAQGRQQRGQEDMNPLIGFALSHAEEASLHHLKAVGLQVRKNEEQAIFRRG